MPNATGEQVQFRWPLPVHGDPPPMPPATLLEGLSLVSSATACAKLQSMGVRRTFIDGPTGLRPGQRVVGPARTLQFMPHREDIVVSAAVEEYVERHTALWRVFDDVRPGEVLVVQAFGSTRAGCLGEMLIRTFRGQGGVGVVVDGRIRDSGRIAELDVPVWSTGSTPLYATQDALFPWAYHVPIACGGVLVLPGDIIIADEDGAVVVPAHLAPALADQATAHEDSEEFSRASLDAGGPLSRYYPLDEAALKEYNAWQAGQTNRTR